MLLSFYLQDLLPHRGRVLFRLGKLLRAGDDLVDQVPSWGGQALELILLPQQVRGGG